MARAAQPSPVTASNESRAQDPVPRSRARRPRNRPERFVASPACDREGMEPEAGREAEASVRRGTDAGKRKGGVRGSSNSVTDHRAGDGLRHLERAAIIRRGGLTSRDGRRRPPERSRPRSAVHPPERRARREGRSSPRRFANCRGHSSSRKGALTRSPRRTVETATASLGVRTNPAMKAPGEGAGRDASG